jgi:hypothetical protein
MKSILEPEIQLFIDKNINSDIKKMALQKNPFPNTDWRLILSQIESKSKSKKKLPTWFSTKNIIYPAKISIEQTSSEATALYKSSLVSGKKLIDLTGGFGVDANYFSKNIDQVFHCEINAELSSIVKDNFDKLSTDNVTCISGDSLSILKELHQTFDWIYIDPSRRSDAKGKVFLLKDCLPNVSNNLDFFLKYASNILIKTAPILDISAGLLELKFVKKIHVVALEHEVKELLWEIEKDFSGQIEIKTIDILKEKNQEFSFILNSHLDHVTFSKAEKYLYEPNAAIMKSGGFDKVAVYFKLSKLHQHSHLYTSNELIEFPGRRFEVKQSFLYNKAEMTKNLKNSKINITTRNFPISVVEIRKKWNIEDGGYDYCFFTTDANNNKIVLICAKI